MPPDYDKHNPEQKQIYRFVRTLFSAAQLTAECAIVTLVSARGSRRGARPGLFTVAPGSHSATLGLSFTWENSDGIS